MKCPDPDALAAFHHGRLALPARVGVERHIAACAACRREVEEMERLDRNGAVPEGLREPHGLSGELWNKIRRIRSMPLITLRVTLGREGGALEVIDLVPDVPDETVPEAVTAGAGVRGSGRPGDRSGGQRVFRISGAELAGTVILRAGTIRILMTRAGRPAAGIFAALTGGPCPSLRCSGRDGGVRFGPLPRGEYRVRLYDG